MTSPAVRIVALQYDIAWEDREANFARVRSLLARAEVTPGSLVVLPEMFATGWSMNTAVTDEADARPGERFVRDLALRCRSCVVAGVVARGADGRPRNQALVVGPDGTELARYAKMYPMTVAGERDHYAPGDRVVTFVHGGAAIAPTVCYDLRFPELYRAAAKRGAEVLLVIASFPAIRAAHWRALLIARAIENQAYVVGVNRIGVSGGEKPLDYAGGSLVVDPLGNVVADAGGRELALVADLDLPALRQWRADFPALDDIRDDL